MPLYNYQVMDRTGKMQSGKIEAENDLVAASRLQNTGYTVLEIKGVKQSSFNIALGKGKKVSIGDLTFFSRQLAAMLTAGIPLTRSLFALSQQTKNPKLANIINEAGGNVESGMSFSEALRAYPEVFSSMYVDMIKAGEIGGTLDEMLNRLSDQLQRDKSLRDSIRSATFYPSVVITFAAIVVLAMMIFIVPIFSSFFPAGMELPLMTRIVMWFSATLRGYWYLYLIIFVILVLLIRVYIASSAGHKAWEVVKFKVPVFGELFKKATVARFCRTLSTLLAGGIPVLQALEAAGPASGSKEVTEVIKMTGAGIQEGQSIATPLERSGFFPPMVTNMIAVGEETGELSSLLAKVADFYEEEVATMTKGLTAMIEPLLIIVLGCIIGGIVIAVYMPIFSVVTSVG